MSVEHPAQFYAELLERVFTEAEEQVFGEQNPDRFGLAKYAEDPVAFNREVLGEQLWSASRATMRGVMKHKRVVVSACRSSSKSRTGAGLTLALTCTAPTITITTAPTARQVRRAIWEKIRSLHAQARMPLPGRCLLDELQIGPDWYALGVSTDHPDAMQGFHSGVDLPPDFDDELAEERRAHEQPDDPDAELRSAEDATAEAVDRQKHSPATRLFFLLDEAIGMQAPIIETMKGSWIRENVLVLMQFNPTHAPDSAHPAAVAMRPGSDWHRIHIAAHEFPSEWEGEPADECFHGVPRAIMPQKWIDQRAKEWGTDDPLYRAHVVGLAAAPTLERQFIPFRIIREAFDREEELAKDRRLVTRHIGWDVAASEGGDFNVASIWINGLLVEEVQWRTSLLMQSVDKVVELMHRYGEGGKPIPSRNVHVDRTGVGVGAVERMRERGYVVDAVDFGEKPKGDWARLCGDMHFVNRKAELLWSLRRANQEGIACVPRRFADLVRQMQWHTWDEVARAEGTALKVVESKDDLREQYGRSPDNLDAALCAWSRGTIRPRFRAISDLRQLGRAIG